jgi:threonine synthase
MPGLGSLAFSVATSTSTYQALAALRRSGGLAAAVTEQAFWEGQRALASEEGLFVELSSAAALDAAARLRREKLLAPE